MVHEHSKLVETWFKDCPFALVAFSGGVDSSLLAFLARKHLGDTRMVAVISASPSLKLSDLDAGKMFCLEHGIPLKIIETEELKNIDMVCQQKPAWKAVLLWGALVNAAQALTYNWIANEFDYSIGGISLSIEKSSKYEGMKQNAEDQWDKLTEAKARTTKYMRGLSQPRFGRGVRSAFGPYVGRGVLSPRSFV